MDDPQPALLRKMRGTGKTFQMKSRGLSMAPLMHDDSVVTLVFDPVEKVKVGDIILFQGPTALVLHRVVERREEGGRWVFREKGDHQPFSTLVEANQVLARLVKVETDGRTYDADSPRSRRATRWILWGGRVEMWLYGLKRRLVGSRPTRAGRAAVRAQSWLRACLLKVSGRRG